MRFAAEPARAQELAERTAVLLVNLGTPDAPTSSAVRRYLAEFLSDPRVVEIPPVVWRPILYGVILRIRPAKSAAKYASVWTDEGSPLLTWTRKQAARLLGSLGERGHALLVQAAMRYGQPPISRTLDALKAQGATRVLILPLYPQYSGATTGSTFDAVAAWTRGTRRVPDLRFVADFHDHPGYIEALAQRVIDHWRVNGQGERLVLSFHGLPRRTVDLGDPYQRQCLETARLLGARLGIQAPQLVVSFQSRFGKARWLEPYTEPTLRELAAQGVRRVDVMCPGFVADCLETLEEINIEARAAFIDAGGESFHYIDCLNDSTPWIRALVDIALDQLRGWDTLREAS
jgi:protoporphyrin/coproporphyrin ferrochelatase